MDTRRARHELSTLSARQEPALPALRVVRERPAVGAVGTLALAVQVTNAAGLITRKRVKIHPEKTTVTLDAEPAWLSRAAAMDSSCGDTRGPWAL